MTRRSNAPDSALTVRIIGSLLVVGAYAVFRLPELTSAWEAAATWVGAVTCGAIAISAIEELGLRRYFRAQSIRDAVTEVLAPVREWPDATELAIAEARHTAMLPIIDRGDVVEPTLFTHEFQPLTPPSGVELPQLTPGVPGWTSGLPNTLHRQAKTAALRAAYTPPGASEYTGRHRLADAQLTRERNGQFFGTL